MQKIVKLNRAFLYCCMVVLFCLRYEGYAAPTQGKPVSITIKNSSLADVLRQVSKKSGLYIYFQDADLARHRNVSLDVKNKPVESVLHDLLDERGLAWVEVSENTIAVKKKPETDERKDTDTLISVAGKITNERGEPLEATSIVVKNTNKGTATLQTGKFELEDVTPNSILVISRISYYPKELAVNGRSNLGNIVLSERVTAIDETVVIAYGQTSQKINPGNVNVIKYSDIQKQPINNPLLALQSRVPGLEVLQSNGLPGTTVSIKLRGRNTLRDGANGTADPLIVIDGLPVSNTIAGLNTAGSGLSEFSLLNFVNPNDIESISVLKDADATSIYGSRGANGVILITTKKGNVGGLKVDMNYQIGWGKVNKTVKLLGTSEYLEMRKEGFANAGIADVSTLNRNLFNADVTKWDQTRYTNWQKQLIGNTSSYSDAQVSISGGVPNFQYLVGGNFHHETTVFPGENRDMKGGAHVSLTGKSTDSKLTVNVNASYMADVTNLPGIDFTNVALTLPPNAPRLYKDNGSIEWEPLLSGEKSWVNPISALNQKYDATVNNLISSAEIRYSPLSFLTLKTSIGYNKLQGEAFKATYPFAGRAPEEVNNPAAAITSSNGVSSLSIEPQIQTFNSIGRASITGLLGVSYQKSDLSSQSITGLGYTNDALLRNLAAATNFIAFNNQSQYKYCALFSRITYNYEDRYIINLTGRRDGSSRFGSGNQFGNFGSVGVAWVFTNEEFFKRKSQFLHYGKLRASYGSSGNDGIGDYQYLERYEPISEDLYQGTRGYRSQGLFNTYYAWEVTKKLEFGIEFGLLDDRIFANLSYYRNRSNNQLLDYSFPSIAGPGNPKYNLPAVIQNKGYELLVTSTNIKSAKFSWTTSINLAINRNKLIAFPDLASSPYYSSFEIGQPFSGVSYAYNYAGVDPQTGQYQFRDFKGNTTLTPEDGARLDGGRYLRIMTDPKFFGGISNTITYRKISLDFLFQFKKQTGVNPVYQNNLPARFNVNQLVDVIERWQKVGDDKPIQKYSARNNFELSDAFSRVVSSSANFVDASFIRLKNASLSYHLSERIGTLNIKSLRVFVQAQNVFTLTKYKGLDPETQSLTTLPPLRTITVGFQMSL